MARALRDALLEPFQLADTEISARGTSGSASIPIDADDAEALLKHADIAMYADKERGHNGSRATSGSGRDAWPGCRWPAGCAAPSTARSWCSTTSRWWSSATGRIVGAEALIRWNTASAGWSTPAEFIPLAERTGLIRAHLQLGDRRGLPAEPSGATAGRLSVSVNLPPRVRQPTAMRQVLATIEAFGLDPTG